MNLLTRTILKILFVKRSEQKNGDYFHIKASIMTRKSHKDLICIMTVSRKKIIIFKIK